MVSNIVNEMYGLKWRLTFPKAKKILFYLRIYVYHNKQKVCIKLVKRTSELNKFWHVDRYGATQALPWAYGLSQKLKNLHDKSQLTSFYSVRDLKVHLDGQTGMARSSRLVVLIKNIYTSLCYNFLTEIIIPSARV